jgi:hypothetical protein
MYRVVATLLLVAHLGALTAPTLAAAGVSEGGPMTHCVRAGGHAEVAVTQTPEECDACNTPDCLAMAGCAHTSVAIVSTPSINFTAAAEIVTALDGSSDAVNLLRTPFPPPPKS